jgi:hypothetical protein
MNGESERRETSLRKFSGVKEKKKSSFIKNYANYEYTYKTSHSPLRSFYYFQ